MNHILSDDIDFIFNQLKELTDLSLLNNKNIFITGGTGLFGKSILNILIHIKKFYNFRITVLTRDINSFISHYPEYNLNYINFIQGDIRNFQYNGQDFDYIIHAATPASAKLEEENPNEMYSIALEGTKKIIELTKKMNIEKLLFTSSGAIYGNQPNELDCINEEYEGNPITYYGKAKKISEQLLLESDINVTIARCFAFVGPYLNLNIHFAIGNFIKNVINNEDIVIKGDGRPLRTYLYTADLIIWLLTMLLKANNKSIYNVGSSNEISIYNLAKKVSNCMKGYKKNINILTEPNYNKPTQKYIPNNTKIIKELYVKENFDLETSIKRTIKYNLDIKGK